jgi:hypothetical protein
LLAKTHELTGQVNKNAWTLEAEGPEEDEEMGCRKRRRQWKRR